MNQHIPYKSLYFALISVAISSIIYLMAMFGLFDGYTHFFGKTHPHKWHSLFRVCFVGIFIVVNHWFLVPQLYIKKRYLSFISIVFVCLISLLVLPDIVLPAPPFEGHLSERPQFNDKMLPFPMRTLMFELAHVYLLFFIGTFISIALKTRQYMEFTEQKHAQQLENQTITQVVQLEQQATQQFTTADGDSKKEVIEERSVDTALTVTVDYSLVRIEFSDICFIKSMGNYLHFFLKDKKPVLVRMTLKEATDKLPNDAFTRVHKSYIVAVAHIEHIRNKMILINEQEIPIGRAYEDVVLKIFGK